MARTRIRNRWELHTCARRGHVTFAPDHPQLADRLSGCTGVGEVWRCLRCADFVAGPPQRRGPVAEAPTVLRGPALRQAVVMRLLSVERLVRAVLIALAAWAVWEFHSAQVSIQGALDRDLPVLRAGGIDVDQLTLVSDLERAVAAKPSTLILATLALAAYATVELVESVGLWLLARWGEYFAVIATSVFLPWEVYDLVVKGVTTMRLAAFGVNVAAVLYLVVSKRLFGVRGGREAYDRARRGEQLLDLEAAALR